MLKLDRLSVEYRVRGGYLSAVKDVSLNIGEGEIFAVVGESGCGKSTIAHSIMRLLPDRNERVLGGIYFEGHDLNALNDRQMTGVRGKKIGMIFQNPLDSLNPVYRSGSQVAEAIFLDKKNRAEVWREVIEFYREMKMPDPAQSVRSFPHELSGGMRQRVMIAMMLARNPKLLIADEPTTALDVTIEAQILEIMSRLRADFNTSILLITHNFGIVAEIADRVAVMYAGEVAEQGSVFEIFQSPSHPYTELLMKALPHQSKREGRLRTIEGSVPRITSAAPGCRFCNRCPAASERCEKHAPPVKHLSSTHSYACHNR
ncbi:MAG: ABC transporter ATP-binding protein [Synergistaceae bacterium]|jgi:oligopeptide/dipeptide ABC transporter ATP-binding protein|nr:ABC transporter ATP-binding protein [Synergistaceae bacterium]